MFEKTHGEADLERLGALGLKVEGRILRLEVPAQTALVPSVKRIGDVTRERYADRSERAAEFDVGEVLGHVADDLRQHDRSADRGIEERFGIRVRTRQLRRPVVTARQRQVVRTLVTDFGRCEDRLGLFAPALLRPGGPGRIAQVLDIEHVGQSGLFARLAVGNGAADLHGVVLHVREGGADVGLQRPVVAERLVDIEQGVAVNLAVHAFRNAEEAVLRQFGQLRVRRSVGFLGEGVVRIVDADTPRDIQPVEDVVGERRIEHVTVLAVLAQVAVVDPVGVLHGHSGSADGPVLRGNLVHGIVSFVHLDLLPVVAAGEEIGAHDGVVVGSLIDHVAVFLQHVAGPYVQPHLIVQKRGGVAEREVVAVVAVVGHDAAGVDRRGRKVGLIALRTRRKRETLAVGRAGAEVVLTGIVTHFVGAVERFAPAQMLGSVRHAEVARTVPVLELGKNERSHDLDAARHGDGELPRLSLFGRHDDGAVGRVRTVQCGRSSARQYGDRLDVLGVDVGDRVGRALRTEFGAALLGFGEHRHAVDHVKRIGGLRNGLHTAHDDLRSAADARRRGVDVHTGHLTIERVDEVGVLVGRDGIGIHLLHVVRQGFLGAFDAQGRNDDLLDFDGRVGQRDVESRARADGHDTGFVTDEADRKFGVVDRGGDRQGEVSVDAGGRSDGRALDQNGGSDNAQAAGILHHARDGRRPRCGDALRQHDVGNRDLIGDVRVLEQQRQHLVERLGIGLDRDDAFRVDFVRIKEKILGLLFDFVHDGLHRNLRHVELHRDFLRLGHGGRAAQEHGKN